MKTNNYNFSTLKKKNNYLNPDQANAPRPTANVRQIIDPLSDVEFDAKYMKKVWLTKAPQLKIFLTYESYFGEFLNYILLGHKAYKYGLV